MSTSAVFLLVSPVVIAVGILRHRRDFRRHGRTTYPGVLLLLAAWLMPICVLGFAVPFFPEPERPGQYAGYGFMILGLLLTLGPLHGFSTKMVVGRETDELVTGGPYRDSRNPQYLAFFLVVLGYALTGRSLMAYAGVALYMVVVHLTVRVEEEHLERRFGDAYRRYRTAVPRYFLR